MSKKTTVICKTCGAEIAANAKACPSCGGKNKKPLLKKPIFWILIVLVVVIIGVSIGSKEPKIDYSKPDFTVTADDIMSEYNENSVAAQGKYGDKIVRVTGKISTISEYSIRLSGEGNENWLTSVVISFAPGQDDVIKSLSKDMEITAIGRCDDTDIFSDIEIKDAKIDTNGIEIVTTQKSNSDEEKKEEIIDVDIDDLLEAYDENPVAADSKYKNKTIRLTGKIASIEDGYIRLDSFDVWNFASVYAYYNSDEDVSSLKNDGRVTVVGVCKGKGIFNIELKKCTFEK